MRGIGYILVILGALALGYEGFIRAGRGAEQAVRVSPVLGGIVLVSGLLVLAVSGRRAEG